MKDIGFLIILLTSVEVLSEWSPKFLDLPDSHITRYLNSFKEEAAKCRKSSSCAFHSILDTKLCWGYEADCPHHLGYSNAHCPGDHKGWVNSKSQQLQTFFNQADFGFVKQQIQTKTVICTPMSSVRLAL